MTGYIWMVRYIQLGVRYVRPALAAKPLKSDENSDLVDQADTVGNKMISKDFEHSDNF
jgi:hypothetical protein